MSPSSCVVPAAFASSAAAPASAPVEPVPLFALHSRSVGSLKSRCETILSLYEASPGQWAAHLPHLHDFNHLMPDLLRQHKSRSRKSGPKAFCPGPLAPSGDGLAADGAGSASVEAAEVAPTSEDAAAVIDAPAGLACPAVAAGITAPAGSACPAAATVNAAPAGAACPAADAVNAAPAGSACPAAAAGIAAAAATSAVSAAVAAPSRGVALLNAATAAYAPHYHQPAPHRMLPTLAECAAARAAADGGGGERAMEAEPSRRDTAAAPQPQVHAAARPALVGFKRKHPHAPPPSQLDFDFDGFLHENRRYLPHRPELGKTGHAEAARPRLTPPR